MTSILLIDLDNFKSINDSLGYVFGDKVLIYIRHQFEKISSTSVFIPRCGGDEFIIGNVAVNVNFSVGISQSPKDSKNIDQLIMNADMPLYE